jgi:hypothetical protein
VRGHFEDEVIDSVGLPVASRSCGDERLGRLSLVAGSSLVVLDADGRVTDAGPMV